MNVTAEITAVQARIAQITGTPPPTAPLDSGGFAAMLQSAMDGAGSEDTAGGPAQLAPPEIDQLVTQSAARWSVDPALVKAIIANESGFDPAATSNTGAQGLMQLEPGTAAELGVSDAYDPAQNVAGGTRYIRGLLDRFGGDLPLALAAYNAGPGAVEKYGGVPPYAQTQNYVRNVLSSYDRYRAARTP